MGAYLIKLIYIRAVAIEPLISFLPCKSQAGVGVDVGSKALATLSNGVQIEAPKPLKMKIRRLKRLSRQLSKKQHSRRRGDTTPQSNNYKKQKVKVAKLHADISNIRKDTIHKVSTFLTDHFEFITIEDLNIKGMMANGKLARTISDLGLYELRRQLEYKSKLKGNKLVFADRWFPSSKTCSCCGNIKSDLKLSDRTYSCEVCGFSIDRDLIPFIFQNMDNRKIPYLLAS